tara:strand:- start:986 stop:1669 length:684 start_codon:yes stop_codon:yes gene_type:complete
MNNKIKKKSPARLPAWLAKIAAPVAIGVGMSILGARKKDRKLRRQLGEAQEAFDRRLKQYEDMEFQPIDPNIVDQENIFEDMEIDTTSYEMQRKAFLQQQANILSSLQQVSGSAGAASLATALSRGAEEQAQQATMTTAQMINRAKELRLQEESRINQTMTQIELANAEGARQFELDKLTTLLGVEGQKIAGIRGDQAGRRQMYGQIASGIGSLAGNILGNPTIDLS